MNSSFSVEDDASSSFEEDFVEGFDEKADNSNNVVLVLSDDEVDFDNCREGRAPGEQFVPVVVGSVPLYVAEGDDGKPVYIRQMPHEPPDHKITSNNNSDDDDNSFGGFSDNSESTFEGFGPVMFEGFTDEDSDDDSQFDGFSEGSAEAVEGKQKIEYIRNWQKTSKCYDDLDVYMENSNDSMPDLSRMGRPSTSKGSRPLPGSKERKNVSKLSRGSHSKRNKNFSLQDKSCVDGKQNKAVLDLGMHSNSSPSAIVYEGKGKQQCLVIAPQLRSKDIQSQNEKDASRFRGGREKTDRTYVAPNVDVKEEIEVREEANHLYEDEDLIGPYCSNVGCTISWLESMTTKKVPVVNGIVYELSEFAKKINWEQSDVAKWILRLHGILDVEPTEADVSMIRSVMKRRKALMVTLAGNKRGHLKLQEFDAIEFILPAFKKGLDEAGRAPWNVREHGNKRKGRSSIDVGCPLPSKRNRSSSVDVLSSRHGKVSKEKEGVSVTSRVHSRKSKRGRRRSHLDTRPVDFTNNALKKLKKSDSRVSFQYRENSVYPHFTETDECLGKHSKKANLTINDLNSCDEKDIHVTNGLVIELYRFYRDRGCTVTSLAQRLLQLKNLNSLNLVSLVVKITKLAQKSHHPAAFIEEEFLFPRPKSEEQSKRRFRGGLSKSKAKQGLPDHPSEEQRNQLSSVESMSKNISDETLVVKSDSDVLKDDDSGNIKHDKEMDTPVVQMKPKIDVEEKAVEEVVMEKKVVKVDSPKKGGSFLVSRKPDLDANQENAGDTNELHPEMELVQENGKELKLATDEARELELQNSTSGTSGQDVKCSVTNLIINPNKTNEDECHKEEAVFENKNKASLEDVERAEDILGEKGPDLQIKAESLNEGNRAVGVGEEVTDIVKQEHSGNDYDQTNVQDDDCQSQGSCSHSDNYLSDENDSSTSEVAGSSREILSEREESENKLSLNKESQNCQEMMGVHNDKMVNETFNEDVEDKIIEENKCKSEEHGVDIVVKSEQGWNESVFSNTVQDFELPYSERSINYSNSQLDSSSNRASKEKDSAKVKHLEGKPSEVRRSERERTLSARVKEYHSVSEFYNEPIPQVSPKKLKFSKPYEKLQDNYKHPTASFSGKSQKRITNGMALEFLARQDPRVSFSICDGRITPHFNDVSYYLGEHCEAAGLTVEDLNSQEPKDIYLTRGAVVELIKFYRLMGCTMTSLADRLLRLKMIYLDSILNLVARFQPLMKQEGNFSRMQEEFVFPPGQHNVLKRTPNRKNPKTKNKTDSLKKGKKEKAPTYTCEVIFKPKKKKKKKRETDATSENVVNVKKLGDFKKKKQVSEVDVSKVHGQVVVDKEVEKARGKEGSVTRADIVLLYANWLNNKHKTGNNVFVTDLLQDVMKLMEERKVQTIRIPAGTLMSSSVKLYEEYRQMWNTNKADAMMYLEDDWLEDIQYLVSITQTSRRNTMEMSEGDGSVTDDNRPTATRNFEDGEREFSDSSSERSLRIDESYVSSDEDLRDFENQEKTKKIRQQQNAKHGTSIKMLINKSKLKKKSSPHSQVVASSSSELQEKCKWSKRHEIEEIIDYRCTVDENSKKQVSYLVRRKGSASQKATWVDENQLRCPTNLKGWLKEGKFFRNPQDKLIWQQPTFQQTVGFPIKLNTCEGLRVADYASVSKAGNAFHDEVNDKENSPHNLFNIKYNTDKGYMTNGELLHMYDCWRQDNAQISSTKDLIDIHTFTEKVEETMQNYGIKTNYSEYLLQACFTLTLVCRMLSSKEALREFLDKDCLPALESSKANQESNKKISGISKIGGLSDSILNIKSLFREMKGKRSANQARVHIIEDEVEKLERSLDISLGQPELLSGALHQEINRLTKKLTKLNQEEDIPIAKEFQSENPEKYEKACQDILECGVPERNIESIMNSVLQVIDRFSVDAKKASDK
ncbi:uncharacterized protein LOC135216238 [Macrobrachium nipponense]|uniref:uncharacterized protein LOC135216238 n=1 Tax=Macrobrachium nipponense TaxID=159736 RepID=UPI0030C879E5